MNRRLALPLLLTACGTSEPDTVDCATIALEVPEPRGEHAAIWDAPRQRLVTFGGNQAVPINCAPGATDFVGDTWAFVAACDSFQRLATDAAPRKRGRYALGHDTTGQRMLLHGGRFRNGDSGTYTIFDDTWALDLTTDTWTRVSNGGGPGARSNHGGAVIGDAFVVFGGNASDDGANFQPLNDVWSLDLATNRWTEIEAPDGPSPRLYHAVATDGERLFVYGGGGVDALFGDFMGDLWALDVAEGTWQRLHDGDTDGRAPTARIWGTLVHDAANDRLVHFAGHDGTPMGNTNDLWAFDLGTLKWKPLVEGDVYTNPSTGQCEFPADFTLVDTDSPERREAGAGVLTDAGQLMIFGGKSDCGNVNDVWTLDLATDTWTERFRATAGEVCLRTSAECSTMCF